MPCYRPFPAWQLETGEIVFKERGNIRRELELPCGGCIGCRSDRASQWASRCMHEAQMHSSSCFVTLTYDEQHCPISLHYPHFQSFMRTLRRRNPGVRFYMCGEYGDQTKRPHYHAILFGAEFSDRTFFKSAPSGSDVYLSASLQALWPYGFATVGDCTYESAAYVARYCIKKVTGKAAEAHYKHLDPETGEIHQVQPEFARMSLKPGIGAKWLEKYLSDVYTVDGIRTRTGLQKTPRYYDKLLKEKLNPQIHETLEASRYQRARAHACDNTTARLATRETVHLAKIALKKRSLE